MTQIQLRRGLASLWASTNPILGVGEQGLETDTKRFKVGDGVTAWNSLAYVFDATSANATFVPLRKPTLKQFGTALVPIWGRLSHYLAATSTITAADSNSRLRVVPPCQVFSIRAAYGNWKALDAAGDNALTITAAVEYPAGTYTPLTFGGQRSVTVQPGGLVLSDPCGLDLPATAGSAFWIRTYCVTASPFSLPNNTFAEDTGDACDRATGVDKTTSGTIAGTNGGYGPCQVLATVPDSTLALPLIACVGDSLMTGNGGNYRDISYVEDKCRTLRLPTVGIAEYGSTAAQWAVATQRARRIPQIEGATHAVVQLGTNDLVGNPALATFQANVLAVWTMLNDRGMKVYGSTVPPHTSTTDNWATLANQTFFNAPYTPGGRVEEYNTWLRDGAPIDATTKVAVATGTSSNTLRAGATGHPLIGYLDISDAVSSSRNSGKWAVTGSAYGYTTDGIHWNAAGQALAKALIVSTLFT